MIRVALAQIDNSTTALDSRVRKIVALALQARTDGAQLLLTPELSLCGYWVGDALLQTAFKMRCWALLQWLCRHLPADLAVVVGAPLLDGSNALVVIAHNEIIYTYRKEQLACHEIFDEYRYFRPETKQQDLFFWKNFCIRFMICEDLWHPRHDILAEQNFDLLVSIHASPFHDGKWKERIRQAQKIVESTNRPLIYLNSVGAQDSTIFDGQSFGLNRDSVLAFKFSSFQEEIRTISVKHQEIITQQRIEATTRDQDLFEAIVYSIKMYCQHHRFTHIVLGLSGGIDSALTLCLACEAIGAAHCTCLMMPSRFSQAVHTTDAEQLVQNLGCPAETISIEPILQSYEQLLHVTENDGFVHENLQARIRGQILMTVANRQQALVLNTSNKSERAVGYSTLYGDSIGGFAPIQDLLKSDVYALAQWYNRDRERIPQNICQKEPTAELRHNQKDRDSLPDYAWLDALITSYLDQGTYPQDFDTTACNHIIEKLHRNEYKRKQGPIGPRLFRRSFGPDWRWPTHWPNIGAHDTEEPLKPQKHSD